MSEDKKPRGCGVAILWALFIIPMIFILSIVIPRGLADGKMLPLCEAEKGIRVFERSVVTKDQFSQLGPARRKLYREPLFGEFRLHQDYENLKMYGVRVTRHKLWIERLKDRKRMSEATYFFRENYDVYYQGRHCGYVSPEELFEATFEVQGTGA